MIVRPETVNCVVEGVSKLEDYYNDIRALYEFIDIRFRLPEYGVKLTSVYDNKLISNASGYMLSDDSSYPFYLWTPSWLGRFYIDPTRVPEGSTIADCPAENAKCIAFVWSWLGMGDAYIPDKGRPECWIGVAEPNPINPMEPVDNIADMIFKQFRFETTTTGEDDDWITGRFYKNDIGSSLTGEWFLKRIPMDELSTFYAVNKLIVRPICEKYYALLNGSGSNTSITTENHLFRF